MRMLRAVVFFAEGFEETEAITIVDVLRRAAWELTMISVSGKIDVTGSHGIAVKTDSLFENTDFSAVDILILPGGMPGSKNLSEHSGLIELLLQFNAENKPVAAICAAPFILGQLGLLNQKKAVCYPGYEEKLTGAEVLFVPAVVSGNIVTGRGVGAVLDFSLKIVETFDSKEKAEKLAQAMLVPIC